MDKETKNFLIKFFVGAISIIIGIISIFFVFDNYLSDKINDKITNPDYMQSFSKTLRPFMIFDQNKIRLYDHGVTAYVDSISINYVKGGYISEIIIHFNKYIQNAPLLESLGPDFYNSEPKRGIDNIWIMNLKPPNLGISQNNKFRLELLPPL